MASNWKWECHREGGAHNAACPLKLPNLSGSVKKGSNGRETRSFSQIANYTQGRAFAHRAWPANRNENQDANDVACKEAARQQAVTHNHNQPFFQLPREIRDMIYEALLANERYGEVRMLHRCPFSSYLYQNNDHGGSLTQVSRQIRDEFFKDYLFEADPIVWIEDLPDFIDVWLPSWATDWAKLTIDIVGSVDCTGCLRPNRLDFLVDITRIVQFRQINPFFNFKILRREFTHPEENLGEGHRAHSPFPTNSRYIEDAVEKIQLRVENGGEALYFCFQIREAVRTDWFYIYTEKEKKLKQQKLSDLAFWMVIILNDEYYMPCPTWVEAF